MGRVAILPKQIKKAIVLRDAGHSLSSIVDKLGISASTLQRAFKKHSVERGTLTTLTIEEARQQLLNDAGFIGDLKATIASSICEDLSLARQIRDCISLSLEEIVNDISTPASVKARSLAALSVSLKSTSDTMRRALQIDDSSMVTQEIPSITITKMTAEEIREVQSLNDDDEVNNE